MATKRKEPSDEDTLYGYIQSVSTVKKSRTSSTTYFDGVIQTGKDTSMRFVSFVPEKVEPFQTTFNMKSPVKLTNPKFTPSKGKTELTVHRGTELTVSQKRLDFGIKPMTTEISENKQIHDITGPSISCTLTVKVIQVDDKEQRTTMYGSTVLQTVTVADETGNIRLPLWGDNTSKLTLHKSYKISNLCSKYFNNTLQVNTTRNTHFIEVNNLEDVDEVLPVKSITTTAGRVLTIQITSTTKCVNCNKPMLTADAPGTSTGSTVRCVSCKTKQRMTNLQSNKKATMRLVDATKNQHNFVVFSEVLESFCKQNGLADKDDDSLEDYFLEAEEITVNCSVNSDIVIELTKS